MVTTRKASGGRAAAPTSKQSTLSFNHRVTKAVPKSAKEAAIEAPASKKVDTTPAKPSPLSKSAKPEEEEKEEIVSKVEVEVEEPEKEEQEEAAPVPEKSEAEVDAEKITDAQINKYWRGVEAERIAKRVHQEDLDTSEKVLRYFDVSSQYGVCQPASLVSGPLEAQSLM